MELTLAPLMGKPGMNDPRRFDDHPSDHDILIRLVERVANYMESNSATLNRIEKKVDDTNGSVADVITRQNLHDQYHGPQDINIAARLKDHADNLKQHADRLELLEKPQTEAEIRRKTDRERAGLIIGGAAAVTAIYGAYMALVAVFG